MAGGAYERVYAVVRRIPRGRVATYGQIAELAGLRGTGRARRVGYALHALPPGTTVPWHRVINARGEVSRRRRPGEELAQRLLLQREGVRFDARGRLSLAGVGWRPRRESRRSVRPLRRPSGGSPGRPSGRRAGRR